MVNMKEKACDTTFVAPKLVGTMNMKGQMEPNFQGKFNDVPGWREQQSNALNIQLFQVAVF